MLYQLHEQNLFLHTPLFFEQQMIRAGGLLTWTASFLTQFFYYPMLGAGLLGLLWAFLIWLLRRTFALERSMMLTLIPITCLLITITNLGYWVYYLKLPGHAFAATIGTMVVVGLGWLFRSVPQRYFLPQVILLLTAIFGYPLFGFYALWAVALMAAMAWADGQRRVVTTLLAVLTIASVPLMGYHTIYHQTNIAHIYWAALPVYARNQESCVTYYLPYLILVGSTFGLLYFRQKRYSLLVRSVVLTGVVLSTIIFWFKDGNFHREMSMVRCMEQQQWKELLAIAKANKKEPTRAICMMKNLALFRLGQQPDQLFAYPEGDRRPQAPFSVRMVHTVGKQLYLQYGVVNYCYRWCMEDGVEYGWTVERLKLMALCSILNKETVAAQRFLNLLKKTTFCRSWAKHYEQCLRNPQLVYRDPLLAPILPLLRQDNFLTADQSQLELFLFEQIMSSPGDTKELQRLSSQTIYYYRKNRQNLVEQ